MSTTNTLIQRFTQQTERRARLSTPAGRILREWHNAGVTDRALAYLLKAHIDTIRNVRTGRQSGRNIAGRIASMQRARSSF